MEARVIHPLLDSLSHLTSLCAKLSTILARETLQLSITKPNPALPRARPITIHAWTDRADLRNKLTEDVKPVLDRVGLALPMLTETLLHRTNDEAPTTERRRSDDELSVDSGSSTTRMEYPPPVNAANPIYQPVLDRMYDHAEKFQSSIVGGYADLLKICGSYLISAPAHPVASPSHASLSSNASTVTLVNDRRNSGYDPASTSENAELRTLLRTYTVSVFQYALALRRERLRLVSSLLERATADPSVVGQLLIPRSIAFLAALLAELQELNSTALERDPILYQSPATGELITEVLEAQAEAAYLGELERKRKEIRMTRALRDYEADLDRQRQARRLRGLRSREEAMASRSREGEEANGRRGSAPGGTNREGSAGEGEGDALARTVSEAQPRSLGMGSGRQPLTFSNLQINKAPLVTDGVLMKVNGEYAYEDGDLNSLPSYHTYLLPPEEELPDGLMDDVSYMG